MVYGAATLTPSQRYSFRWGFPPLSVVSGTGVVVSYLGLDSNQLSGSIPSTISALIGLRYVVSVCMDAPSNEMCCAAIFICVVVGPVALWNGCGQLLEFVQQSTEQYHPVQLQCIDLAIVRDERLAGEV